MTDETRRNEERMPSDTPEPPVRPEFLPAQDGSDAQGRRPEPPASFGTSWGDPSGRSEAAGAPPYESRPYSEAGRGRPGQDDGAPSAPQEGAPSFGAPDPGAQSRENASIDNPSRYENPYESPSRYENPSGYENPARFESPSGFETGERPAFGPPDGPGERPAFGPPDGPGEGPAFGARDNSTRAYDSPFGEGGPRFENPSFGGPDNGTQAYERPPFGQPYGNPPPPPRQALGMGPGWGPPPPGAHGAGAGASRRGPGTGFLIAMALVIALVASLLGSVGTYLLTRPTSSAQDPSYSLGPVPSGATNRPPDSVAGVASRVLPSVVSLEVGNGSSTEGATGSGFLIKDGYVVTNNHVVALAAGGGEIRIQFNNRKTTTGRIVGRDPGSDLAVVKPEETFGTPELTLGNSDQVVVGDPVIAIGSPLGLTGTVTTGIVSSLNRPVIAGDDTGATSEEPAYISAIQTDAAINPGNSGGPLVNGRGEVVGVNSAIATLGPSMSSSQSGSIGLGFAIPVNQTRRVAEELITTGRAKRPKIGILLDRDFRGQGVKIATEAVAGQQPVTPGGPADKAGLRAGDVILEIDGLPLQDGNELIALIRSKAPGSKINVKYLRDGKERNASLTVMAEDEPTPTRS
ncbi:trypsin-like peptidase domain-containing protein [Nonomuraea terrae]|uniref:trypsin-like peptidase domain-containing protein n=1 Tax=Nonomuraea terrae TaxID=2530383 RepID=UPI0037A71D33